jgi:hypothetical protein
MKEEIVEPRRPIFLNTSIHLGLANFSNWSKVF